MPHHKASHDLQVLLCLWDVSESRESVVELLNHINIEILSRFCLENQLDLSITGDGKVLPYLTGSKGSNSNSPCPFCLLEVKRGKRSDNSQFLKTPWNVYQKRHNDRPLFGAPKPILSAMEILGLSSFGEFVTPPSLHSLLSVDSFIKIAINPRRMLRTDKKTVSVETKICF